MPTTSHQPTPGRDQLLFLLSVTSLRSHTYTPASSLQAKQPQFIWSFLISHIFPPSPIIFILVFSAPKLVTEIENWSSHGWEKQTTPFLVGRLFVCWGLVFVCFTFQNHAIPASYSGVIVTQLVFCQTVLRHLFPSNLSKPARVDTSGFLLSASRKLFCCRIFLRPKGWDLPGSCLTSHTGSAVFLPFPASQELIYFTASQSSALAAAAIHPEVHLVPLSWVWND